MPKGEIYVATNSNIFFNFKKLNSLLINFLKMDHNNANIMTQIIFLMLLNVFVKENNFGFFFF